MKSNTCCFTGHRKIPPGKLTEIMRRTELQVRELIETGVVCFLVGGAVGYDTEAAKLLFRLRSNEYPDIRVVLVYPFDGYTDRWTAEQKAEYARLFPMYDERICVAPAASREAYLARDRKMVDEAAHCIAYCTRQSGGTAYTVRYAKKQGIHIYNVVEPDKTE